MANFSGQRGAEAARQVQVHRSMAATPGDAGGAATAHCGWFESSFELQRGLAVVELHGTVRLRQPAPGTPAAAPAWTLT